MRSLLLHIQEHISSCLVTGGAGFIGSHLVDNLLLQSEAVRVLDNLSSGSFLNISKHIDNKKIKFTYDDVSNLQILKVLTKDINTVFHLSAYPEVISGAKNPEIAFNQNVKNTFCLLEEIRKSKTVERLVFTSSSTVYGEPNIIPTPEDYGVLLPISHYGASKLSCEALISSYSHTYGIKSLILRLANIVGSRSRRGVVWDFIKKLIQNSTELQILGDGLQSKSYLHIRDLMDAIFIAFAQIGRNKLPVDVFNVGNEDKVDVLSIAKAVRDSMNLGDAQLLPTGGIQNGRGWVGDVTNMQLDIKKIKEIGWIPSLSSLESVIVSCNELLSEARVPSLA